MDEKKKDFLEEAKNKFFEMPKGYLERQRKANADLDQYTMERLEARIDMEHPEISYDMLEEVRKKYFKQLPPEKVERQLKENKLLDEHALAEMIDGIDPELYDT